MKQFVKHVMELQTTNTFSKEFEVGDISSHSVWVQKKIFLFLKKNLVSYSMFALLGDLQKIFLFLDLYKNVTSI